MVEAPCGENVEPPNEELSTGVTAGSVAIPVLLVVDGSETSGLVVAAVLVELLLAAVDVASAGLAVTPCDSLLCDVDELPPTAVTEPLGAVAAPEAGVIPSVPGFIVGNADELSSVAVVELGLADTPPAVLPESTTEEEVVDAGGTV